VSPTQLRAPQWFSIPHLKSNLAERLSQCACVALQQYPIVPFAAYRDPVWTMPAWQEA